MGRKMVPKKLWTREELAAVGITEDMAFDRTNHAQGVFMSWDVNTSGREASYHYPHIKPKSVLVTPIGTLWEKDAWWRLQDMLLYTAMAGHSVSIQEMRDSNLFSSDAISFMRWSASMLARDSGVEWLLMVDNDALVEKDTLVKLLAWDMPVVFPLLEDLEQKYPEEMSPLHVPERLEPNTGLQPVRWSAMSVMLFNPKIFNVLEPYAWRGTDFQFGQALNYIGHREYVDTNTVVKVARSPSRHAQKGYDEFWAFHREMYDRLKFEDRDRQPPPGFNPETDNGFLDKDGTYFAVTNNVAKNGKEQNAHR